LLFFMHLRDEPRGVEVDGLDPRGSERSVWWSWLALDTVLTPHEGPVRVARGVISRRAGCFSVPLSGVVLAAAPGPGPARPASGKKPGAAGRR